MAFIRVGAPFEAELKSLKDAYDDEKTGLRILKRAIEAPARQVAENSAFA